MVNQLRKFRKKIYQKRFGYEETSGKTPIETIKIFDKMGVDNAVERAEEFGKDPKLNKKKKKGSDMRIRITEKEKIEEIQKQKMLKVVEDIKFNKRLLAERDLKIKKLLEFKLRLKNFGNNTMCSII